MSKVRLLIPLTVQFSVRYVIRTGLLNRIKEYADPVIVLGWEDPELEAELKQDGVAVYHLPPKKIGIHYLRVLKQLTHYHLRTINTPTTAIDQRRFYQNTPNPLKLYLQIRNKGFEFLSSFQNYNRYLLKKQNQLVWSDTNIAEYEAVIQAARPDMVFCLTPYFLEEELLLRAAARRGIPMSTAILSFDNLTTRGYIPIAFDEYYLWNRYNVEELKRIYPDAKNRVIKIVGAPQFDFYYDPSYIWAEERWRQALGLPVDRPVILFGSASKIIAPQEEQWVTHLDQAIEEGEIQNRPIILMRRHPNEDFSRWEKIRINLRNVYFDEPWEPGKEKAGKTNITRTNIEKLASTLFHCAIHINASSTMTVDGAIYNRPQIGPAYDETGITSRLAKEIYLREHYLPITLSGGLEVVESKEELISAVNSAFNDPDRLSKGRKKIIEEICTYDDGKSAQRVNLSLFSFVNKHKSVITG